jgi:hypothetical protein
VPPRPKDTAQPQCPAGGSCCRTAAIPGYFLKKNRIF